MAVAQSNLTFLLRNYGAEPLYVVDGWGHFSELPPMIGYGGVPPEIPPSCAGKLIVERYQYRIHESGMDQWIPSGSEEITKVPSKLDLMGFELSCPELNLMIFGNSNKAEWFRKHDQSLFSYYMRSLCGTYFQNTTNYGIMNCTGRRIYQVDDFSDQIIPIDPGPDVPTHIHEGEEYIFPDTTHYLKVFRYLGGAMGGMDYSIRYTQKVVDWDMAFRAPGENFVYLPDFQCCMFDSEQAAINFLEEYGSVDEYYRTIIINEFQDDIKKLEEDISKRVLAQNRRVVFIMSSIMGLQISGLVAKYLWDTAKSGQEHPQKKPKKKPSSGGGEISAIIKSIVMPLARSVVRR